MQPAQVVEQVDAYVLVAFVPFKPGNVHSARFWHAIRVRQPSTKTEAGVAHSTRLELFCRLFLGLFVGFFFALPPLFSYVTCRRTSCRK